MRLNNYMAKLYHLEALPEPRNAAVQVEGQQTDDAPTTQRPQQIAQADLASVEVVQQTQSPLGDQAVTVFGTPARPRDQAVSMMQQGAMGTTGQPITRTLFPSQNVANSSGPSTTSTTAQVQQGSGRQNRMSGEGIELGGPARTSRMDDPAQPGLGRWRFNPYVQDGRSR